jgi:hypothetical protein
LYLDLSTLFLVLIKPWQIWDENTFFSLDPTCCLFELLLHYPRLFRYTHSVCFYVRKNSITSLPFSIFIKEGKISRSPQRGEQKIKLRLYAFGYLSLVKSLYFMRNYVKS